MPKISNFVDGINHPQMIDLANWVSHISCFLPLKSTHSKLRSRIPNWCFFATVFSSFRRSIAEFHNISHITLSVKRVSILDLSSEFMADSHRGSTGAPLVDAATGATFNSRLQGYGKMSVTEAYNVLDKSKTGYSDIYFLATNSFRRVSFFLHPTGYLT